MFRKFFYENSGFMESETIFAEITNKKLAAEALNLKAPDQIIAVQNNN